MSDSKLEKFEVFVTRKGPTLVSGENRIAIVESLLKLSDHNRRPVELCNITAETKQPKSSTFNALEAMVESGILRYAGTYGKKGYLFDSYRIIGNIELSEKEKEALRNTKDDIKFIAPFSRMYTNYIGSLSFLYSIDILPIMKTTGHDFGNWISSNSDSPGDALENIKRWFSDTDIANITFEDGTKPVVKVEFKKGTIRCEMARVMGGFIISAVAAAIKKPGYSDYLIDEISTKDTTAIGILRFGDLYEDIDLISPDFKFDEDADDDFTLFVSKDSTMKSVLNPAGLSVLNAMVRGKPMSSSEITNLISMDGTRPQSSTLFYLEKLVAAGLVTETKINNKRKFVKVANMLFTWQNNMGKNMYDPNVISGYSYGNADKVFEQFVVAFVRRLSGLGILLQPISSNLAHILADDVCEKVGNAPIETVMDCLHNYPGWSNFSELNVVSLRPFVIVRLYDSSTDPVFADIIKEFDTTFFEIVLNRTVGLPHTVRTSPFNMSGKNGYKLSFETVR